jgi:hypothetical protein
VHVRESCPSLNLSKEIRTVRNFGRICTLAVLALGVSVAAANADEKEIPLKDVPKAVTDAFKAKFPKATIKNAIKEEDAGKVTYEIESTMNGLTVDAVLKPNGDFVAIEKEIKVSELPGPVPPGVQEKFPKSVIQRAEQVVDSDGTTTYEVVTKKADGKNATLIFDKNGKFLEVE